MLVVARKQNASILTWNQFKTTCTGGKTCDAKSPNCRKNVSKCPTNGYIVFNAYYIWDFKTLSQEPFIYCFSLESVFTLTYRPLAICSMGEVGVILNWKGSAQAGKVVRVFSEQPAADLRPVSPSRQHRRIFIPKPGQCLSIRLNTRTEAGWGIEKGRESWHYICISPHDPPCPAQSWALPREAAIAARG